MRTRLPRRRTSVLETVGITLMALAPVAWIGAIITALVLVARSALTDAPWSSVAYAIYPAAAALALLVISLVLAAIAAGRELK